MYYDVDNSSWYSFDNDRIPIAHLNSVIGRTVILHERVDDGCTQPTGNAGSRLAQCVIGISSNVQIPSKPKNCCPPQKASYCNPGNSSTILSKEFPWIIIVIIAGVFIFIFLVVFVVFIYKRTRRSEDYEKIN